MKTIEDRQALGLTLVRLITGTVFLAHGWQKLFVFGHAGLTGFMTQAGIPFPALSAYLISFTEFFGGIALLLGLFTRLAAVPLAFSMLVAVLQVHLKGGFFLPTGMEYALTMLATNLSLAVAGGGAFALDKVVFKGVTGRQPELSGARA